MIRLATVFSGIGAIEAALHYLEIPYEIVFACDNGERSLPYSTEQLKKLIKEKNVSKKEENTFIKELYLQTKKPNLVKKTYFANYKIDEQQWYEDIRFLFGNNYRNKVDLFVGGSPCQSFSNMGKREGLTDTRGTLFYEYARLVKEIQPKIFIYENVTGMLNHDKGNTWETIKKVFNQLGYKVFYKVINASEYGIPQNRKRIFAVGFKNNNIYFSFPEPIPLTKTVFDYLEEKVQTKYYLGQKGFEFVTTHKGRAKINESIMRTQKANQQFNWNGSFIFERYNVEKHTTRVLKRAYLGKWNGEKGVIRQLTPRECARLMGFKDSFVFPVNDINAYRQAGNSIVVDVLMHIIKSIIKSGALDEQN